MGSGRAGPTKLTVTVGFTGITRITRATGATRLTSITSDTCPTRPTSDARATGRMGDTCVTSAAWSCASCVQRGCCLRDVWDGGWGLYG
jgi:hypothetical protein